MRRDAAYGAKVLDRIQDDLEHPDELRSEYIRLLVEKAQQNASSRPTPQSALAADALTVSGSVIRTSAGIPSEVGASSEFGSDLYPQFQHSHSVEGLWLHPAAEDVDVLRHTDQELEELLEDAK